MDLQKQLEELSHLVHIMQNDYSMRIDDLQCEIEDLNSLIEQQEAQIKNLRNEG